MAYKQREANPVAKATTTRLTGLKAIDPALDLGNGLSIKVGQKALDDYAAAIEAYNLLLKAADDANNKLLQLEKGMTEFNKRTLAAVASKHGDDSSEYELAGGIRRSERKKPVRKPKS